MDFEIVLNEDSTTVKTLTARTPKDNDFGAAASLAVAVLFDTEGVNNVYATRVGADQSFFYAEKF